MQVGVEMLEDLRHKLRMFSVPLDGESSIFCNNEAVYQNNVVSESILRKKHHYIEYYQYREAVSAKLIIIGKQGT